MQPITGTHGIRQSRMRINIYGICIACVPLSLRSNLSFYLSSVSKATAGLSPAPSRKQGNNLKPSRAYPVPARRHPTFLNQ